MLNFELLPNWKDVAKKAWSMWGNYITMILAGFSPYLKSPKATVPPSGWR